MITPYKPEYLEQIKEHLDKESIRMFENDYFVKLFYVDSNSDDGEDGKDIVKGWTILQPSKDRLIIDWIFVKEKYRQQKIGTQLMEEIKKYAKENNFRGISVNTGSNTVWARNFYEKNGFEQVGKVKKFFNFDKEHVFYWFEI